MNQQVRVWLAAVDLLTKQTDPGERAVLYALAEAAVVTDSPVVEHGNRSLAIATGLDQSTVGRILKRLRDAPRDRCLIDLVRDANGIRAHTYSLVVPPLLRPACEVKPWRRGRIHAIRPAFRELGLIAAFVYDTLEQAREPLGGRTIADSTGFGHSAVYDALTVLAGWGLANRLSSGWALGPASPRRVADQLDVHHDIATQISRYRHERIAWWRHLGLIHRLDHDQLTSHNRTHGSDIADTDHWWQPPPDDADPPTDPDNVSRAGVVHDLQARRTAPSDYRAGREAQDDAGRLALLQTMLDAQVIT